MAIDISGQYNYVDGHNNADHNDHTGHGTCMLSKVVGPTWGVSKGAKVTVVRLPKPIPGTGPYDKKDYSPPFRRGTVEAALFSILEDIDAKGIQNTGKIVVSMSISLTTAEKIPVFSGIMQSIKKALQRLVDYGVVIVASSGNNADPKVIVSWKCSSAERAMLRF